MLHRAATAEPGARGGVPKTPTRAQTTPYAGPRGAPQTDPCQCLRGALRRGRSTSRAPSRRATCGKPRAFRLQCRHRRPAALGRPRRFGLDLVHDLESDLLSNGRWPPHVVQLSVAIRVRLLDGVSVMLAPSRDGAMDVDDPSSCWANCCMRCFHGQHRHRGAAIDAAKPSETCSAGSDVGLATRS